MSHSQPPHQLPDQRQGVHWTPLVQVYSSDADQREVSYIPAQLHSIVTVLQLRYVKKNNVTFLLLNFFFVLTSISLLCV